LFQVQLMKKLLTLVLFLVCCVSLKAQDSVQAKNPVTILKDQRIELLGKKMTEYNESLSTKTQMVKGFRLMLMNTTDRVMAMKLRTDLMQQYPDQKVYTIFVSPYTKIKFGNFVEKTDAEKMRKQLLASKIVSGNIYIVPEKIEMKPEKTEEP
jgi:hypothetical protein